MSPSGLRRNNVRPVTAGIVLAAGTATRFGSLKQVALVAGRPLVQHAVDAAVAADLDEIVVVVGHRAGEVEAALDLPTRGRVVRNPQYAAGLSTSLRTGLAALGDHVTAAVVLLGDQPTIDAEAVRAVVDAHAGSGKDVVRVRYGDRPGHPVLLTRAIWPHVTAVSGDRGARDLIERMPERVLEVDLSQEAPADVDTVEDHRALIEE